MEGTTYLALTDGKSAKFYEVTVAGAQIIIRYGRIGTEGQQNKTHYPDSERAQKAATQKINEKLRKGYVRTLPGEPIPVNPAAARRETEDVPPPSIGLLNQAFHRASGPPAIAKAQLPQLTYPLGFTQRDLEFAHLNVPLRRSLVCFELVATFADGKDPVFPSQTIGQFALQFFAQGKLVYQLQFLPKGRRVCCDSHNAQGAKHQSLSMPFPPDVEAGQLFHLVLVMATPDEVLLYLNNQPLACALPDPPRHPVDCFRLNYRVSGLTLHMMRVLEPRGADADRPVASPPLAVSSPPPGLATVQVALTPAPIPAPTADAAIDPATLKLPRFFQDLPPEFEPLRSHLEASLIPYLKMTSTEQEVHGPVAASGHQGRFNDPLTPWQSKIGGYPYLPKGMPYPADARTGQMMMFLQQINCGELPRINGLDLPKQGLLQFYVGLNVPACEVSPERHRVLYFPEINPDPQQLVTDFSFLQQAAQALEWYGGIYALSFTPARGLFLDARRMLDPSFKAPPGLADLWEEFDDWLYEYSIEMGQEGDYLNKLGGYPEMHSTVSEVLDQVRGQLLLEVQSPDCCDDNFYFYIQTHDLANRYFNNIESYFLRT